MSAKTHSFIALYSGESVSTARLICASAEEHLVKWVAERLLNDKNLEMEQDAHVKAVQEGHRKALSLIVNSCLHKSDAAF